MPVACKEIWKDILGYEGLYQVSNSGAVKRIRAGRGARAGRHILRYANRDGYRFIQLSKNDVKKGFSVHRLVAIAFIGKAPSKRHVVNHKDGNKKNNVVTNLEWCTVRENNRHARQLGLNKPFKGLKGEANGRAILTRKRVDIIRRLKGIVSQRDLAILTGMARSLIQRIHQGKAWPDDPCTVIK